MTMRAVDLIRKKRDSGEHSREEIDFLVSGYTRGEIPDYQMAAWLMATWLRGLNRSELASLTEAMLYSGKVLNHAEIPGKKVDKHSTGGVGDKTSLILAPIVAAGGLTVPMISGRGLGHTGGTLDKLESIPGFNVNLTLEDFSQVLRECGMGLIGQTAEIAPADKKIYALRDATSTVENIGLICASIMSKKLAEGIDALVLDVKVGRGAFMKTLPDARLLARTSIDLCRAMGRRCTALLTAMDAPLGFAVGNAVEVAESIEVLAGRGPEDVRELTLQLGVEMLLLGEAAPDAPTARQRLSRALADGSALRRFAQIVEAQGGDPQVAYDPRRLPRPAAVREVRLERSGFLAALDAELVGLAAVELGAGRARKEDRVDPAAGLLLRKRRGDEVRAGEVLAELHAADAARLDAGEARLRAAVALSDEPPLGQPLVLDRLD